MSVATRAVASFVAVSFAGGAAIAQVAGNEARLNVSSAPVGSSVVSLDIDQSIGGSNYIGGAPVASGGPAPADVTRDSSTGAIEGSWSSVNIDQVQTGAVGNALAINVLGRAASTTGTIDLSYEGDDNTHSLSIGAGGDGAQSRYANASITANVLGDGNHIGSFVRGGGAGTEPANSLVYNVDINGNGNSARMQFGNGNGGLNYAVDIDGNMNTLNVRGGTASGMVKSLSFKIDGNSNAVNYNRDNAADTINATFDGTFTGDNITANLLQWQGDNQIATLMVTNDIGASGLVFSMTQRGFNQSVDATVTHLAGGAGAGTFSITQDAATTGALYSGSTVLAGGGVGTVSQ